MKTNIKFYISCPHPGKSNKPCSYTKSYRPISVTQYDSGLEIRSQLTYPKIVMSFEVFCSVHGYNTVDKSYTYPNNYFDDLALFEEKLSKQKHDIINSLTCLLGEINAKALGYSAKIKEV